MRQTAVLLLLALAAVSMAPSPVSAQGNSLGGVTVDEVRSVYSGFGPYLSGICAPSQPVVCQCLRGSPRFQKYSDLVSGGSKRLTALKLYRCQPFWCSCSPGGPAGGRADVVYTSGTDVGRRIQALPASQAESLINQAFF